MGLNPSFSLYLLIINSVMIPEETELVGSEVYEFFRSFRSYALMTTLITCWAVRRKFSSLKTCFPSLLPCGAAGIRMMILVILLGPQHHRSPFTLDVPYNLVAECVLDDVG